MERIAMPQLGETVTEGTILRWLKQPGDRVEIDDALFEVSTEKVDTEVPSAHAGYLREVLVADGETVPVGALLAILTEGADDPIETVDAVSAAAPAPANEQHEPPPRSDVPAKAPTPARPAPAPATGRRDAATG